MANKTYNKYNLQATPVHRTVIHCRSCRFATRPQGIAPTSHRIAGTTIGHPPTGGQCHPYNPAPTAPRSIRFSLLTPTFHNILCLVENCTTRREKNLEKSAFCRIFCLTFADKLVYNITLLGCMCVFAHFYSTTLIDRKGEQRYVPYLSAQEASSQDGARFP